MAATIHPLCPGPRRQNADDPSAGFGTTTIGGSALDNARAIPARTPARRGHLQSAPRLAAVQRYCGDPDLYLVAIGIAQAGLADRQSAGHGRIDDHGTDLLRH